MLRFAVEAFSEFRILCGNTDRTSVEMALAHHHAAFHNQRSSCKTEFIGAQQRTDHDVTSCLNLAVNLNSDAISQIIDHQGLLSFRKPLFPRRTGKLDRRKRRSTGSAVMTGNDDVVRFCFGNAGSNRPDTLLAYELHADVRLVVGHLEISDQLCQVLDRVNVMMRRWRDQADTGDGVTQLSNVFADLMARQLTAFAGFCALTHLDLNLVCTRQVGFCHTEASACHLFDTGAQRIALFQRNVSHNAVFAQDRLQCVALLNRRMTFAHFCFVALRILAAFTGVALASDSVHGHSENRVGFCRDGPERHGAGCEALHNFFCRFDLFQRNRLRRINIKFHQAAQRHLALALVVDDFGIFLISLIRVAACGVLKFSNCLRRPHMLFAAGSPLIFAESRKQFMTMVLIGKGFLMLLDCLAHHVKNAQASDFAAGTGEVAVDELLIQAKNFKDLGAAVTHVS